MTVPIWDGNPGPVSGSTPFGYFDNDPIFQGDAPRAAKWAAIRLGYPLMNVELQSGSFYAAFEEAINDYGAEIYQQQIINNYLMTEGNPTGSGPVNNLVTTPTLGTAVRMAKAYGAEAGSGGNVPRYTGSIYLQWGVQDYDLNLWALASASLVPNDNIEITRVFYERPPAIVRYFDPYAGTGTGLQSLLETFGFGQFSPGINFMLMPIYFDLQKLQSIEMNDEIRRSAFSYELINNVLRIFPIPFQDEFLVNTTLPRVFFEYIKISERDNAYKDLSAAGAVSGSAPSTGNVSNPSNVPFANIVYSQINSPGVQWIRKYFLAISKEMLGYVRNKYAQIPVPGAEVQLNGPQLIQDAAKEKDDLMEELTGFLTKTSRQNQLQMQADENKQLESILASVPLPIYIF